MLAELENVVAWSGNLDQVGLHQGWYVSFFAFVAGELPKWRDDPDRSSATSETVLTSQLCAHLNSATRKTRGWDFLQFRVEEPDEKVGGRRIDLVTAPSGVTIWIEGRQYTQYHSLMPIECKRLPTPPGARRDKREYLHSRTSSIGGVQRFKEGHHGATHLLGAMIGYIQSCDIPFWEGRLALWVTELVAEKVPGWQPSDALSKSHSGGAGEVALLESCHHRAGDLLPIRLRHLWIVMTNGTIPILID